MPPKAHKYEHESSGEVYDYTQTDEEIANGDVLVVESEGVVGMLLEAWPVALHVVGIDDMSEATEFPETLQFHVAGTDMDWTKVIQSPYTENAPTKDYTKSVELAKEEFDMLLARRSEAQGERDRF